MPGHEEIELALVKLSRATGDRKYLDEAKFFLDQRGPAHTDPPLTVPQGSRSSCTTTSPTGRITSRSSSRRSAVGHAVRATYLYSGDDRRRRRCRNDAFGATVDALWRDVVSKRMYLTGGLGARGAHRSLRRRLRAAESRATRRRARRSAGCSGITGCFCARATRRTTTRSSGRSTTAISPACRCRATRSSIRTRSSPTARRAQRVLRRRVLPGESRAAHGAAAGAHLRAARHGPLRQPVRRQRRRL